MKLIAFSIYLKSNMDRFIGYGENKDYTDYLNLKSNMDRFIDSADCENFLNQIYLKSNMDRFIAEKYNKAAVMYMI